MQPNQINQLFQSIRVAKSDQGPLTVRNGQILPGRVVKFFPENRALLHMNGKQIIAQIDTKLESNQRYLLQVTQTSPTVKMKVLSDEPANQLNERIQALTNALGLKLSKADHQLLQQLMKNQVPLSKDSLGQLFNLGKNDSLSMRANILSEMLIRNLPMTQQVYQSMAQRLYQTLSFNQAVQGLENQMLNNQNQTLKQVNLASSLQLFKGAQSTNQLMNTFTLQALQEVGKGSQTTFQLFQKAGLIPTQTSFAEWSASLKSWAISQPMHFQPSAESLVTGKFNSSTFPNAITGEKIAEQIRSLSNQQMMGQTKALQTIVSTLQQATQSEGLTNQQIQQLSHLLNGKFISDVQGKLSVQNQQSLQQFVQFVGQRSTELMPYLQSFQGNQLTESLQQLLQMQTGGEEQRALRFWNGILPSSSQAASDIFARMVSFMEMTQADVGRGKTTDYQGILSLLQQVQSQSSSLNLQSSAQQVQQILQAMHLSMDGSRDFMQFSAQFPKEMFGLNEDLWMDFEGKKQEDGSIHPEHCRVMFYLDMPQLKEIVLDMQVVNRSVDLTVYHRNPKTIQDAAYDSITSLKEGLQEQEYRFHGLHLKTLKAESGHLPGEISLPTPMYPGGVDFKA